MKFIRELLKEAEEQNVAPTEEPKVDQTSDNQPQNTSTDNTEPETEKSTEAEPQEQPSDNPEQDQQNSDPDRQGLIRKVKNAHLVYKRPNASGKFSELWFYNVSPNSFNDEIQIKKDILSGTDIPPGKTKSSDNSQTYELEVMGNGILLFIDGLPN